MLKASRRAAEIDSKKKLKMLKTSLKQAPDKCSRYSTMHTKEENYITPVPPSTTFEESIPATDGDIGMNGLTVFPRFTSTPELKEHAEEYTNPGSLPASTKEELCPPLLPSPERENTLDTGSSPPTVKILLRRNDDSSWTSFDVSSF